MSGWLLCVAVATSWAPHKPIDQSVKVCQRVADEAELAGLDPHYVIALAYTESRFNPEARSSAGARGPIQILPKFHCPQGRAAGCDFVRAGVAHLVRLFDKYDGQWDLVLCHWNGGNVCGKGARRFARIVAKRARKLARIAWGKVQAPRG